MNLLFQRIGVFELDDYFIHQDTKVTMALMSQMIVVRAECLYHKKSILYAAYSELFEIVPMGCSIPVYRIEMVKYFQVTDRYVFQAVKVEK